MKTAVIGLVSVVCAILSFFLGVGGFFAMLGGQTWGLPALVAGIVIFSASGFFGRVALSRVWRSLMR